MGKTNLGVNPAFYALLAYVLAIFDTRLMILVLFLFVLSMEKNEWVTKHVAQALILTYFVEFLWMIVGVIPHTELMRFLSEYVSYGVVDIFNAAYTMFINLIKILVFAFYVIIMLGAVKGKTPGIAFVAKILDFMMGKEKETQNIEK